MAFLKSLNDVIVLILSGSEFQLPKLIPLPKLSTQSNV